MLGSFALVAAFIAVACGSSSSTTGTDDTSDLANAATKKDASTSTAFVPGDDDDASTSASDTSVQEGGMDGSAPAKNIKTVFVIVMENHSWSSVKNANYIKNTLLPMAAHAENYKTPPGLHPSEPNYIWMEAGDNLGITNDDNPDKNHQATKEHLTAQLDAAGISWKAYAEDIPGDDCPLSGTGKFSPKHTPQLFFDDVTGTNNANSAYCKAHVRPFSEFESDLTAKKVARYNFITPNLCHDMHGDVKCLLGNTNLVGGGDDWLKDHVPPILASAAYKDHGALFILWDEGDEPLFGLGGEASDGPIGFIALSATAKKGYAGNVAYTHSSFFRSLEEIFGVPYLRGAKTATSVSDLFTAFP